MIQAIFTGCFGLAAIWFAVVVFRTSSMVRSALALLFSQAAIGGCSSPCRPSSRGVADHDDGHEMAIMAIFMVMYMMDPGGLGGMDMTHQKRASQIAGALGALAALAVAFLTDGGL
jgi:NADH:ubiquinone oxidoreductase subunit 6 (subunit J)